MLCCHLLGEERRRKKDKERKKESKTVGVVWAYGGDSEKQREGKGREPPCFNGLVPNRWAVLHPLICVSAVGFFITSHDPSTWW